jgi:hypothetical protein
MKLTQTVAPTLDLQLQLEQLTVLKQQMDTLKEDIDDIKSDIEADLHARGVSEIVVGDQKIALIEVAGRSSIDRMRLLEAGVTSAQILAATTTGDGFSRLDIRTVKAGKK